MTNEARILDHTTIVLGEEKIDDGYGEMATKVFTIEGIPFTLVLDVGYVNYERKETLYLEGTDDESEFWYAQTDPFED